MKRLLLLGLILVWVVTASGRPRPVFDLSSPSQLGAKPSEIHLRSSLMNDTIYFGGTRWAADSLRWEAIRDSVWTFDTGVGSFIKEPGRAYPGVNPYKPDGFHGGMEGWIGNDLTYEPVSYFRRLSDSDARWGGDPCVGSSVGLGGHHSFWIGVLPAEAESLCYKSGKGYGNSWDVCISHSFAYNGGPTFLGFMYSIDIEENYDYVRVYCDSTGAGDDVYLVGFTGTESRAVNYPLSPGVELPRNIPGTITIKFCFSSDGAWSDEDGLYSTRCGAFALDNIVLTGGVTHSADFETTDDGWQITPPPHGLGGDWTNLLALSDLPPLPPELAAGCSMRDTVLVLFDPDQQGHLGGHPPFQDNMAVSPWIDLDRAGATGRGGFVLDIRGFADMPLQNYILLDPRVQWFPDSCGTNASRTISPWRGTGFAFFFGPATCLDELARYDFSDIIPKQAEAVRLGIAVVNFCHFFANCTTLSNTTPWLDNVRFGVYEPPTIQAAINAAASGDTVWVPPGTYLGPGNVNLSFGGKSVVLKAEAGSELTIIDGAGGDRAFISDQGEDSASAVIGFTFNNCAAPENQDGGAIYVGSGSSMRFEDCVISNSTGERGGGLFAAPGAAPVVKRCYFLGNTSRLGGAIATSGGDIDSCQITENHADEAGGGLFVVSTRCRNSLIDNNTSGKGGGVYAQGGQFLQCRIHGNSADFGGGIYGYQNYYGSGGAVELTDCTVTGNGAKRGGGLELFIDFPPMTPEAGGGAELISSIRMAGTTVAGNQAQLAGGLYSYGDVSASRCIIRGNGADSSAADVILADQYATVTFTCSALDSSGLGGSGQVVFDGPQVFGDPLFCGSLGPPTPDGHYTLASDSPCLPGRSPCDSLIGALGQGCDLVAVLPPPDPEEPPFLKTPGIHAGPNPFPETLTIHYLSPIGTTPRLEIYSVDGRLMGKWPLRPGSGVVKWDGRDPIGKPVASGIYFVRYIAGDLHVVRRVVRIVR